VIRCNFLTMSQLICLFLLVFSGCKSVHQDRSSKLTETSELVCQNRRADEPVNNVCRNPFVVSAGDEDIGLKEKECSYYLGLRMCLTDCNQFQRNRLLGYYQTCMGVTGLAAGDYKFVSGCSSNDQFKAYTVKMRQCLQRSSVNFNTSTCHTCAEVIDGAGGPYDGIIGSHTPCNETSGFCELSQDSLKCFGAGLGSSWQGVAGNHSVMGAARSVGFCHLLSQAASCASTGRQGREGFLRFWRGLCVGYQAGCVAMQAGTGTLAGNTIEGITGKGGETVNKVSCKLSCPLPEDLNRLTVVGGDVAGYLFEKLTSSIGRGGVLSAEDNCRSIIGTR
jgi:hypothetical protein